MPEFMPALGQFLDGSRAQGASLWLLSNIPGFPPIVQSVHILGIAMVMGSIVMLDLRILGLAVPSQQLPEMARRLFPWLWLALTCNLVSGLVFVFARPLRYFTNPVFVWKAVFLLAAILTTLLIQYWSRKPEFVASDGVRGGGRLDGVAAPRIKVAALFSLGLWVMVAMAGRWIAYAEYLFLPA